MGDRRSKQRDFCKGKEAVGAQREAVAGSAAREPACEMCDPGEICTFARSTCRVTELVTEPKRGNLSRTFSLQGQQGFPSLPQ